MAAKWQEDTSKDSKAESRRDRYKRGLQQIRREVPSRSNLDQDEEFDWFAKVESKKTIPADNLQVAGEKISDTERKSRMLHNLSRTCKSCSMCDLGLQLVGQEGIFRDPHVLSNGSISKVMLICKSPDWDSLKRGETFNGSREKFDSELEKYGLSYHDFYICSILRCYSNSVNKEHIDTCKSFLQMEVNLLKPRLMIAMGQFVFSELCGSTADFNFSLNNLVKNDYGIKTISIYETNHPNFGGQIKKIAKLVAKIN